ncbi:MAG: MBL fold metallo-hydrolase [Chloroflexota bacterium]
MKQLSKHLYLLNLSGVNAYLLDKAGDLILIDTGSPGDEEKIESELREIGKSISHLSGIIVTHCHPDHAGSLAAVQKQTEAPTFMHHIDAELVEAGRAMRSMTPTPGLLNRLLFRLFIAPSPKQIDPARVDHQLEDDEVLNLAGGLRVVHTPGHSAGQIALLWEDESVLFVADALINLPRLNYMLGYEDFAVGKRSANRLSHLNFETVGFGHGKPILKDGSKLFRSKFVLDKKLKVKV